MSCHSSLIPPQVQEINHYRHSLFLKYFQQRHTLRDCAAFWSLFLCFQPSRLNQSAGTVVKVLDSRACSHAFQQKTNQNDLQSHQRWILHQYSMYSLPVRSKRTKCKLQRRGCSRTRDPCGGTWAFGIPADSYRHHQKPTIFTSTHRSISLHM